MSTLHPAGARRVSGRPRVPLRREIARLELLRRQGALVALSALCVGSSPLRFGFPLCASAIHSLSRSLAPASLFFAFGRLPRSGGTHTAWASFPLPYGLRWAPGVGPAACSVSYVLNGKEETHSHKQKHHLLNRPYYSTYTRTPHLVMPTDDPCCVVSVWAYVCVHYMILYFFSRKRINNNWLRGLSANHTRSLCFLLSFVYPLSFLVAYFITCFLFPSLPVCI